MAMINREGLNGRDDFIGFTFKGRHSSEFNIIQVSTSSRMGREILPSPKDTTIQVAGTDGAYYYSSQYGTKTFNLNLAFNDLRESDFRAMQYWLADKATGNLIFDEEPYKAWDVKINSAPQFNFVCFDEIINGQTVRVYKGEGKISFISYSIIAKAPFPFLEAYNWDFINHMNGYDISAYFERELNIRNDLNEKYSATNHWSRHLLINDKDKDEKQLASELTLDSRLVSVANSGIPADNTPSRLIEWYNFNQWKDTSRLKTQAELDRGSIGWESIISGYYYRNNEGKKSGNMYELIDEGLEKNRANLWQKIYTYKQDSLGTYDGTTNVELRNPQRGISCAEQRYRRYGYCSDSIFTLGVHSYHRDINSSIEGKPNKVVLLDHPSSKTKTINAFEANGIYIQNEDYRRKVTRYYAIGDDKAIGDTYRYGENQAAYYKDTTTAYGGTGTTHNVIDPWAGKIGPSRGITGDKIYIYNPGNYKTYPKIIITVLDKRSMITRSRCNFPYMTIDNTINPKECIIHGLDDGTYKGNYEWRYATFTLYPRYKTAPYPGDGFNEKDIIGRFTLDLMALAPKNSARDNVQPGNNGIVQLNDADGSGPSQLTYVIDCELRLIYRCNWNTQVNMGWGPGRNGVLGRDSNWNRKIVNIDTPFQYYNTTFTPINDIRNNAMVAGDFFEIPPYELDIWNDKEVDKGEYVIDTNSAGSGILGPFNRPSHWAENTRESDNTWIGQRVVWDINYL